jgi:hypothetical protein
MPSLGNPVVLASGRLCRQIATNRSDNPVYVDAQGKLTCHHGERSPSIMYWNAKERAEPGYKRPSVCDCANVDGLLTDYTYESPSPSPDPATPLYKLLHVLGAEEKTIRSRPQRKVLGSGESEIWVQPSGTIVCAHGNTRKMVERMKADPSTRFKCKSIQKCHCTVQFPKRIGSVLAAKPTRVSCTSATKDSEVPGAEAEVDAEAEVGMEAEVSAEAEVGAEAEVRTEAEVDVCA